MRPLKRIRIHIEVLLVRISLLIVPPLPRICILRTAQMLGWMAYAISMHPRKVGHANLDMAYGDQLSPREKRRIIRMSFETFALMLLDVLWFSRHTEERISKYVKFDPSFAPFFEERPQLCIGAHFGNWEVLGLAMALKGTPPTSIAADIGNPAVHLLYNAIRQQTGQVILKQAGAIRKILTLLRDKGKIGILLDQNTKPSEGGIFANFFGKPVPVSNAGASLALRTGCDLFFCFCLPQPDGSYLAFSPACLNPKEGITSIEQLTQTIADQTESVIRQHPERWLWMYKRWKLVPRDASLEDYPFYAKHLPDEDK